MNPWTRESFSQAVSTAKRHAVERLMEDGKVVQLAHVLGNIDPETGERSPTSFIVGIGEMPDGSKNAISALLRGLCRDLDAEGVLMVAEAWVRDTSPEIMAEHFPEAPRDPDLLSRWVDENYERIRAELEPKEVLIVLGEYHQHIEHHMMTFTRDGKGRPIPGE